MRLLILLFCALGSLATAQTDAQTDPERGGLRIVVLSDFNGPYGALSYDPQVERVLSAITEIWQPDLLVSAGDVIGGQNTALPAERFTQMWSAFDAQIATPLRKAGIPYAFAIGNHDGSSLRSNGEFMFQRERDAAQAYWQQPLDQNSLPYQSREDFPFTYSFTFGEVFFAVWDASSATVTDEQRAWLARDLSSPAAQRAKLRVLIGHLPLYGVSEGKNQPGEVLTDGNTLRGWLETLDVNLYISGHHAAYYPAKVGELTLLHSGGIGARRLLDSEAAPRSAVTVLDIDFSDELSDLRLTTFDTVTFETIALASLPERIEGLNGTLVRSDLAP